MTEDQALHALEAERHRLEATLQDVEADDGTLEDLSDSSAVHAGPEEHVPDQYLADAGSETTARELDLALLEQVRSDLDDVDRALRRLDEGTYGQCEICGEPIGDERLAAMPAAHYCLAHQEAAETSGAQVPVSGT